MKLSGTGTLTLSGWLAFTLAGAASFAQTTQFQVSTAVGGTSAPTSVTVHVTAGGMAAQLAALTQGLANAEFALVAGGTCTAGATYNPGDTCTANVVFQPRYPGLRSGAIVLPSAGGNVLGTAMVSALGVGALPVFAPGQIDTIAGDSDWLFQKDGDLATSSPIFLPTGIVTDAAGNLYLSDSQNYRIRKVDAQSGIMTTIAGTGTPGYAGDHVAANKTMVSTPAGLAIDGAGNLYMADVGNHVIRRIDAFTGIITTVAGTPTVQGYSGDGGAATQATLCFPEAISFDMAGDLLIADTGNNVIREVDATTGNIRTVAGTGAPGYNGDGQAATAAQLNSPWGVTAALDGSFYIADLGNNRIRQVSPSGSIATVAGTGQRSFGGDGSAAASATLSQPTGVVLDPAGNIYVADSGNDRVREISVGSNVIATLAGTGSQQFAGDGGPANAAALYGPTALYIDAGGNLFVADMFHNRIRRINSLATALLYPTMKVGKISAPQPVLLANDGNAPFHLAAPALVNAAEDAASTTCTAGASIAEGAACNVGAEFAPEVTGNPVTGTITLQSDSVYAPPVISLSGEVLSIQPTSITMTSSANPSLVGSSVTFTATVANGLAPLTGSIVFFDGKTQICSVAIANAGATCSTSALTLGSHSITASYSGDANNAASVTPALTETVKQATTLTLAVAPNPAVVTANVTLSLTSSAPSGAITGTVSFYDGTTAIDAATLSATGTASFSTTSLTPGTHALSVQYAGDALNMPAQSNTVSEIVQQASTSISLFSSAGTAIVGNPVTFTGVVFSANGPTPTGTVAFKSGTTTIGTGNVGNDGSATLTVNSLAPGSYAVTAVYSGDANDQTSTSAPLVEVIQQIATATTLSADVNPVAAGAALHLTATVSGATGGGGALTGKVRFQEGTTTYGSVPVDASGHATLLLSTLPAGSHTLTALFVGDTNYATSTSPPLVEVVNSTATTIVLSSPAATTIAGEPASFTASVTSTTSIPTGNVVLSDSGVNIAQAQLNAQGVATFSSTSLAVGNHSLVAAYGGDSSYGTSMSPALQHSVVLATTALTLATPGGVLEAGKAFALKATLTSNGVNPTGALTLRDGSAVIGTQTVAADGTFTFGSVTLSAGSHTVTAAYAGDADDAAAVSSPVSLVIELAPTTVSLTSSATPATVGQSVTLTASLASDSPNAGGPISFMDGNTLLGTSNLAANGTASWSTASLAFGTHNLTAVYGGDTNHAASTSAVLTEQIVQAASASLSASANPSNAGQNVTFTLKITGNGSAAPSGTVTFSDGAVKLGSVSVDNTGTATMQSASLAVGSHTMSASYSGDANYSAATASMVQTVQSATTQVVLTADANPAAYNAPVTFTATVTGNGGVAAGTVNFTDGGNALGSAQLDAGGVATLVSSALAPGSHSIVANYAGNAGTEPSSSTPLVLTVKEQTQVGLASSANPSPTLSAIVLTATVKNAGAGIASGAIVFMDGTAELGTATLDGTGKATLSVSSMSAGSHALQASYAGDATNFASTSPALSEVIQLIPTTTTVTASATDAANPQQLTLIAVVRWTGQGQASGTVTFSNGDATLGSSAIDSTGVATLTITLQSPTVNVVATYSGDASYAASSSLPATITGGAATQFILQLDPSSVTFASKQHTTVNVMLASVSSFSDTLQLGCLGLPYAATCTFSKPQVTLAANGVATAQLTLDTGDPLGAGPSASLGGSSRVMLCLLPGLLGLAWRRRKRLTLGASLLLLAATVLTLPTMGCSGLHINGTPPGTYTFRVTAAGANTGTTVSQTMTLTVTQ